MRSYRIDGGLQEGIDVTLEDNPDGTVQARVGDQTWTLDVEVLSTDCLSVFTGTRSHEVHFLRTSRGVALWTAGESYDLTVLDEREYRMRESLLRGGSAPSDGDERVEARMPGKVVSVLVQTGQSVRAGEGLLVLEAMKMENEIRAASGGTVAAVHVEEGQAVESGALMIEIRASQQQGSEESHG